MKELDQNDYPFEIVKDLGLQETSPGKKSKRYAEFVCPICKKPYRAYVNDVRAGKSTKCKPCAEKLQCINEKNLITGKKLCGTCKVEKPLEDFYNSKTSSDNKGSRCKPCDTEARNKWTANNPERSKRSGRARMLKHVYGITHEQYIERLKTQDYKCAICGTADNNGYSFSIDHCHTTEKIRGLLCNQCNRGLGMLGDTSSSLLKAYEYLIKAEQDTPQ